ncbi:MULTISPECIES: hypothetical protein [Rhodomicrobium]|uniref:hypothetical protein n=1 Tax=Rhodomicrobium TaxID=1068 RepID=UPI000F738F75|nr:MULTISPECIES: hypothetical protein [Rhodomicrobium]
MLALKIMRSGDSSLASTFIENVDEYTKLCQLSVLLNIDLLAYKLSRHVRSSLGNIRPYDGAASMVRTAHLKELFGRAENLAIIRKSPQPGTQAAFLSSQLSNSTLDDVIGVAPCFAFPTIYDESKSVAGSADEKLRFEASIALLQKVPEIYLQSLGELTVGEFIKEYQVNTNRYLDKFSKNASEEVLMTSQAWRTWYPPCGDDGIYCLMFAAADLKHIPEKNLDNIIALRFDVKETNNEREFYVAPAPEEFYIAFIMAYVIFSLCLVTFAWRYTENAAFIGAGLAMIFLFAIPFVLDGRQLGEYTIAFVEAVVIFDVTIVLAARFYLRANGVGRFLALIGVLALVPAFGAVYLIALRSINPVVWGLPCWATGVGMLFLCMCLLGDLVIWAYREILMKPAR